MTFRTIIQRYKLTAGLQAAPVLPRKAEHNFVPHFHCLWGNQGRAILRKVPAKHTSDVEQRAAPADETCVVWAVADNITFGTQHRILQGNRVETSASFRGIIHIRTVHHRTSEDFLDYI